MHLHESMHTIVPFLRIPDLPMFKVSFINVHLTYEHISFNPHLFHFNMQFFAIQYFHFFLSLSFNHTFIFFHKHLRLTTKNHYFLPSLGYSAYHLQTHIHIHIYYPLITIHKTPFTMVVSTFSPSPISHKFINLSISFTSYGIRPWHLGTLTFTSTISSPFSCSNIHQNFITHVIISQIPFIHLYHHSINFLTFILSFHNTHFIIFNIQFLHTQASTHSHAFNIHLHILKSLRTS